MQEALDLFEVDSIGLDEVDHKILLISKVAGGPVGLDTLAALRENHNHRGCIQATNTTGVYSWTLEDEQYPLAISIWA